MVSDVSKPYAMRVDEGSWKTPPIQIKHVQVKLLGATLERDRRGNLNLCFKVAPISKKLETTEVWESELELCSFVRG